MLTHGGGDLYYSFVTEPRLLPRPLYAMRRYLLLLAPFLTALFACDPGVKPGPRVDFVGNTRFVSSDRVVSTPGDTLSSFIYADVRDSAKGNPLKRFIVTVKYEPGLTPGLYQNGILTQREDPFEYTYLDSTLAPNTFSFVFRHDFTARTTSGRERWTFKVTGVDKEQASRTYQLTTRKADSAALIHNYTTLLQAPVKGNRARRSFLDVTNGLALTGYAAQSPSAQALIDLIYVPGVNNTFGLASPNNVTSVGTSSWVTKNSTELRTTTVPVEEFNRATEADLITGFDAGRDSSSILPSIAEGKIIAFRTNTPNPLDSRTGLIYVQDILSTVIPTVLIQVKVSKRAIR